MSTRIARVALCRRFPRTAEPFDYVIPEDLTVAVGSFVVVPLRAQKVTGVAVSIQGTSTVANPLPIQDVLDVPPLSGADMAFFDALARHTYQSWHSILHAAIPAIPKRRKVPTASRATAHAFSVPTTDVPSVQEVLRHILATPIARVAVPSDRVGIAAVATLVRHDSHPNLIIVGDLHRAQTVASVIPGAAVYGGIMSKNVAYERWLDIRLGRRPIVTTRVGSLVPPSPDTRVTILGSGSDDLLQSDQNPHYDARWCVQQRVESHGNPVAFLDVLPRVEDGALTLDLWREPSCELIDMSQARPQSNDWLISDSLRNAIASADLSRGPFVVYCNRLWKGGGPQTTTRDVADRLRAWFPTMPVSVVEANDPLPTNGIVVVTRTFLYRLPYLQPRASGVAVVRAEQELTYRGFRSLEQAARLLRHLTSWAATAQAPCFIQTDEPDTVRAALGSTAVWHVAELASRARVSYPPYADLHVMHTVGAEPLVEKRPPNEVIAEWLTAPPSCDIFVSPDSITP